MERPLLIYYRMDQIPLCSGTYLESGVVEHNVLLIASFVIGNILTFIAYMVIPFMIHRLKQRPGLSVVINHTMNLFIVFILLCGIGHLLKAFGTLHTVFNFFGLGVSYFHLEAISDVCTGLFSIYTVFQFLKTGMYLLELPTRKELDDKVKEIRRLNIAIEELKT